MGEKFQIMAEYTLALLQLLSEVGPVKTRTALEAFEKKYRGRIPEEMYEMVGNEIKWSNRVRWERLNLARLGLMGNDIKGIWYITEKGCQFLENHPNDALPVLQNLISQDSNRMKDKRNQKEKTPRRQNTKTTIGHPTISSAIPRAGGRKQQSVTPLPKFSTELKNAHQKLEQEIRTIQEYLRGVSSYQPSDEVLCDWVHFCYNFELYAEGVDLFTFIDGSKVNSWYFGRTKKIAKVCEQKLYLSELRKE